MTQLNLSARAYHHILKLARTERGNPVRTFNSSVAIQAEVNVELKVKLERLRSYLGLRTISGQGAYAHMAEAVAQRTEVISWLRLGIPVVEPIPGSSHTMSTSLTQPTARISSFTASAEKIKR